MDVKEQVQRLLDWLRTVVKSWPAVSAAITATLTVVATELVPVLPGGWAPKVLGVLAFLAAVVAAISVAVARLTPVLFPENRGVLAPPPAQSPGPQFLQAGSHVRVAPAGHEGPLPPVGAEAYPPGSERLPHRRRR